MGKWPVRSKDGLIAWHRLEDHGYNLNVIKEWRQAQYDAALPCELDDFFRVHGLCLTCRGQGAVQAGWSPPRNEQERQSAAEINWDELPYYEVCAACGGTGKLAP